MTSANNFNPAESVVDGDPPPLSPTTTHPPALAEAAKRVRDRRDGHPHPIRLSIGYSRLGRPRLYGPRPKHWRRKALAANSAK